MSARRLGGKYLELYKKYWLELNQYKNYNFPDDLASRISKDAELAIKENIAF